MLDFKFIKENTAAVKANIAARFLDSDVDQLLSLYEKRKNLITEIDSLRQRRNGIAEAMKGERTAQERATLILEGKNIKEEIAAKEKRAENDNKALNEVATSIPNITHPDAPQGKDDKDNREIRQSGKLVQFPFTPKDHLHLAEKLQLVDFETAAKVSGSKFYYLKNEAVFLELAISHYTLKILKKHGYTITITPDIAQEKIAAGIGFAPRGVESNIYTLEGTGTCLIGSAEITLGGYHAGNILNLEKGPILLAGLSHCFRREAGAAGQYSKGLYRVHQFNKIEMFAYCRPEESDELLLKIRAIEEEIFEGLGIPFRVMEICRGSLGAPAYQKFDLEAWMPGRGENGDWGEITSASNCTDYQARRLGIRYKEKGKIRYVHTLNGTAVALARTLIAILENGQREDGSIDIPSALVPYCGFDRIPAQS